MPLFVVLEGDSTLDDDLRERLKQSIRRHLSPRHVPDDIIEVPAVPRTLTGKKLEVPIKRILQGAAPEAVSAAGAITDPEMLDWFERFAQQRLSRSD